MKEYTDIFTQDIEVPEVVWKKADDALAGIKAEDDKAMANVRIMHDKKKTQGRYFFRGQMAVAVCISIIVVGSITVVAAIHHFWSRGMQGTIQATVEQQQTLTEQGMAEVLTEQKNYEDLAVTVGGVSVIPTTVITDEKCAHISFSVEGFALEGNEDPCFEETQVYLGDSSEIMAGWVNVEAGFYDGIITDEYCNLIYDDGTPLESDENGKTISRYTDENGKLEYIVNVRVGELEDSLLGNTLHINFKNIGIVEKALYKNEINGEWNFAIPLPDISATTHILVQSAVEGTVMIMDSVEISPISIKINYTVNGEVVMYEDVLGIPYFCGVVLKDGTRLPYLGNGGSMEYTDEEMTKACVLSAFNRVIEPSEVIAVLVRPEEEGADMVEVPII